MGNSSTPEVFQKQMEHLETCLITSISAIIIYKKYFEVLDIGSKWYRVEILDEFTPRAEFTPFYGTLI